MKNEVLFRLLGEVSDEIWYEAEEIDSPQKLKEAKKQDKKKRAVIAVRSLSAAACVALAVFAVFFMGENYLPPSIPTTSTVTETQGYMELPGTVLRLEVGFEDAYCAHTSKYKIAYDAPSSFCGTQTDSEHNVEVYFGVLSHEIEDKYTHVDVKVRYDDGYEEIVDTLTREEIANGKYDVEPHVRFAETPGYYTKTPDGTYESESKYYKFTFDHYRRVYLDRLKTEGKKGDVGKLTFRICEYYMRNGERIEGEWDEVELYYRITKKTIVFSEIDFK